MVSSSNTISDPVGTWGSALRARFNVFLALHIARKKWIVQCEVAGKRWILHVVHFLKCGKRSSSITLSQKFSASFISSSPASSSSSKHGICSMSYVPESPFETLPGPSATLPPFWLMYAFSDLCKMYASCCRPTTGCIHLTQVWGGLESILGQSQGR